MVYSGCFVLGGTQVREDILGSTPPPPPLLDKTLDPYICMYSTCTYREWGGVRHSGNSTLHNMGLKNSLSLILIILHVHMYIYMDHDSIGYVHVQMQQKHPLYIARKVIIRHNEILEKNLTVVHIYSF